ncbi:Uncharacterised protein [Actinomyces bovis]|uniref:Major tail protein n=1 Tax=Actinomyces bovis TaxID=1658 RepID=A0ABY1VP15_9ACTO|nr:hypothetical protein [Actinomyces bovis]SPT53800.1 Uncharacterised protein [Actinomyces bovis]VEG53162.1 Uncharacterised protein [Actinomyces israelii]
MPVSTTNIFVGAPDQETTGAILSAPTTTTGPKTARDALVGFTDSGYISKDGLKMSPEYSTADIEDWSGTLVRRVLQSFKGTLSWAHLETNEESLRNWAGNVTVKEASRTNGKQLTAVLGAKEQPRKSWAFKIKDGERRVLIYVPDGQVTEIGEVSFTKQDAVTWPVTLAAYPDSKGNSIYIFTDDGVVTGG